MSESDNNNSTLTVGDNFNIKIGLKNQDELVLVKKKIIGALDSLNSIDGAYSYVRISTEFNNLNLFGLTDEAKRNQLAKILIEKKIIGLDNLKTKINVIKRPSYRYIVIGISEYLKNNEARELILRGIKNISISANLHFEDQFVNFGPDDKMNMIIYIRDDELSNLLTSAKGIRLNTYEYVKVIRYKSLKICCKCINVGHLDSECESNMEYCFKCLGRHGVNECHLGHNKYNCRYCLSKFGKKNIHLFNHKTGYMLCEIIIKKLCNDRFSETAFRDGDEDQP